MSEKTFEQVRDEIEADLERAVNLLTHFWRALETHASLNIGSARVLGLGSFRSGDEPKHVKIMWSDGYSKWRCLREDGRNSEFFPIVWWLPMPESGPGVRKA